MDYLSPEGLRLDGRRADEIRHVACQLGPLPNADGSSIFKQGNTKVMAAVYGPHEVRKASQILHDRAVIQCDFSMATFSTGQRTQKGKGDRRTTETSMIIKRTFESAVVTTLFPSTEIDIFIYVLEADGGTVSAAINAATLAIIDAGIPIIDFVVSCAAGYFSGTPVLDLNYLEDSAGGPNVPVSILASSRKVTTLQMDSKLSIDVFESVLRLAVVGCDIIHKVMLAAVKEQADRQRRSRGEDFEQ